MNGQFVIVGAGQAATQAIASLRQEGFSGGIVVVGDEPFAPYQRPPLSKKFLLGQLSLDRLALRPDAFYQSAEVDLQLGARAVRIDRSAREVELSNGVRVGYEKLLLATGARSRPMQDLPTDLTGVFYLRTATDAAAVAAALGKARRLVVIGGGYIGLEVASAARIMGLDVEIVEAAPRLMPRVAGPAISDFFKQLHTERGVTIRLNARVERVIAEHGHVTGIRFADDSEITADAVLIGIGAMPNLELAEAAGLAVDGGIVVDEFAQTSDPLIFAAGDCTNHPSIFYGRRLRLESVQNAIEQAKTAASGMCGRKAKPYRQIPWFWSDQYDVKFQAAGLIDGYEEASITEFAGGFAVSYKANGRPIAVEAVNDPAAFMSGRRLLEETLRAERGEQGS